MNVLRRPVPAWGSVILWAGAIWFGSSLNIGPESPLLKFGSDKLVHMIEFGILAALAANALLTRPRLSATTKGRKSVWWLAVAITAFWGVIDEIHQIWVPSRSSDPIDTVADILGGMVGAWLLLYLVRPDGRVTERESLEAVDV
jgi:VanZ family protein